MNQETEYINEEQIDAFFPSVSMILLAVIPRSNTEGHLDIRGKQWCCARAAAWKNAEENSMLEEESSD